MRLTKDVAKLVARERVCRVATAGRDGVPHVVPVCHVLVDGKICFGSDGDARKVKNVRANPRVAVTVDVYSDDWSILRGVLVQGSATIVEDGPRFRKLRKLLYAKYPQYPEESALEDGAVIIEVTPGRVFRWGFE
jgi:PPOX class probable F420-dependent enzyme